MLDYKDVVHGLTCISTDYTHNCKGCPYYVADRGRCDIQRIARDALDLLKEKEAVEPIGGYGFYLCGVCRNPLNSASQKFCSECGKAVKWDET